MRRMLMLALVVAAVLARSVLGGAATATTGKVDRAQPPSYWEAITQARMRPR